MSVKITDKNNFNQLEKYLKKNILYVGVFGGSGSKLYEKALHNEYGTATIPKRSFIRTTFDENIKKIQRLFKKRMQIFLDSGGQNNLTNVYNALGILLQGKIRDKIDSIKTPPNAESTIKAKGSSKPLIDTGQLRQRIDYKVREK